jgi:hypothetical protein
MRHAEVGGTAGVHSNVHPAISGREWIRSGEVLIRGHYVALVSIDGRNLTATFPEHYSLVRIGMSVSGLVIVIVVMGPLPLVVVCCVDRRGAAPAGAQLRLYVATSSGNCFRFARRRCSTARTVRRCAFAAALNSPCFHAFGCPFARVHGALDDGTSCCPHCGRRDGAVSAD